MPPSTLLMFTMLFVTMLPQVTFFFFAYSLSILYRSSLPSFSNKQNNIGIVKTFPHMNGLEGSGVVVGSGGGFLPMLYNQFESRVAFAVARMLFSFFFSFFLLFPFSDPHIKMVEVGLNTSLFLPWLLSPSPKRLT